MYMRQFKQYLITLTILFIISWLILPSTFGVVYPKMLGPILDERVRTHYQSGIVREESEIVLLGDSVVQVGIDADVLSQLMDKKIYKIGFGGSASAVWYLIVKNNLVTSPHKPKYLILFFRDTMLTTPDYRVSGEYFTFVDELADQNDELLIQLAYHNQMSWFERELARYVPLLGERTELRSSIENLAKYTLAESLYGYNSDHIDQALKTVFHTENLDQESLNVALSFAEDFLYIDRNLDFDKQIYHSFLPEIIRLCKDAGIHLIFVKVKSLYYPSSEQSPPALITYHEALGNYLAENHITLIDFSNDARVSPEWYVDIIHMSAEGKTVFTPLLAEELLDYIE
jgi:hypothetical protein